MTSVINISSLPGARVPDDGVHVYIGRAGKGQSGYFGNPIVKGRRCHVCGDTHWGNGATLDCYRRWLANKMDFDKEFKKRVLALKGKTLVCFCKPEFPCHGDVLAEAAEKS